MGSVIASMMENDSNLRSIVDQDSDDDSELAMMLQYLIRSGHVHIIPSDYEDDDETALPKFEACQVGTPKPETELSFTTKRECGFGGVRSRWILPKSITQMVLDRERGMSSQGNFSSADKCKVANNFVPNKMTVVECYPGKAFCGTYSKCGKYFVSACQDCKIRIYGTDKEQFKLFKTVRARDIGWSIIDTAFSPDGQYLAYSSWSESLHVFRLHGDVDDQQVLPLCPEESRFCTFSVVFSSDGREILGGANDGHIYVFDREQNRRTLRIDSHEDDVNTVAYADETSQIFYSGGDDGLAKVWDRRTLDEANPKPVGVLAGHMDGITYVDSRGDGRYLISNSKDQSIKLWDIRVFSGTDAQDDTRRQLRQRPWDYRWQEVPENFYNLRYKMRGDTSIMTYRGHSILKTLVRCRFSPAETTGQRFIYTGCATGRVVVYDILTGHTYSLAGHRGCVRDVSWHPYRQEIASTSWDGVIGLWTHVDLESRREEDEQDKSMFFNEHTRGPKPLRRSQRIALQRERQG